MFYTQQLAKFLSSLEATKDADGNSILHNSMIVYGSGNADGNRQTHSNLPILLAGKGGGSLSSGRRVNYNGKPLTNLYLTLGERMGVDALDSFGDSTGPLKDV